MKKLHQFDHVHDSQKVFRLILKALSNPLECVNIKACTDKLFGENKELLGIAMTLLDNETTFSTCENPVLSDEIMTLTLSKRESIEKADYVFIEERENLEKAIENVKYGTLVDPHLSGTLIVKIPEEEKIVGTFVGPGICGKKKIAIEKTVLEAVKIRDDQFFEYPQGIDFIFTRENGDLFGVPRLTKREVL
ncbi:MAG: phosphonate C-P lyase system protein PhnH [Eubacteriaceae bacterium]